MSPETSFPLNEPPEGFHYLNLIPTLRTDEVLCRAEMHSVKCAISTEAFRTDKFLPLRVYRPLPNKTYCLARKDYRIPKTKNGGVLHGLLIILPAIARQAKVEILWSFPGPNRDWHYCLDVRIRHRLLLELFPTPRGGYYSTDPRSWDIGWSFAKESCPHSLTSHVPRVDRIPFACPKPDLLQPSRQNLWRHGQGDDDGLIEEKLFIPSVSYEDILDCWL